MQTVVAVLQWVFFSAAAYMFIASFLFCAKTDFCIRWPWLLRTLNTVEAASISVVDIVCVRAQAHALTMLARSYQNNHLNLNLNMYVCVCMYANWFIALCTSFWNGRHSGSFATTKSSIFHVFVPISVLELCVCTYVRLIASFFPSACVAIFPLRLRSRFPLSIFLFF